MALVCLAPEVRRVFDVCQLPRLLYLCADEQTAQHTLTQGGPCAQEPAEQ
jgi:hypothetical protein